MNAQDIDDENRWRLYTPGHAGWARTVRLRGGDRARKYFVVSADSHAKEPFDLWATRIDARYRDRLPRVETDAQGQQWRIAEGWRPTRMNATKFMGEDALRNASGHAENPLKRLDDNAADGIDVELVFPDKGLAMFATPDPVFANAQCRVYNDWIWELFSPHKDRLVPAAAVATGDLESALAEIRRVAQLGFRVLTLPSKPVFGAHDAEELNYNLPHFDPLWALVQDLDLPITFHVATGRDPRGAKGNGGAIINYAAHALTQGLEPVVNLCASGLLSRFPRLRFAIIEAGIGWVPWLLGAMDEAYVKHHMWVRPKLAMLPSEFFQAHGFATFQEDRAGLALVESSGLAGNFMWGNDYPHHEGTWPHSEESVERAMGHLKESTRAQLLGLNAARFLRLEVPAAFGLQGAHEIIPETLETR